MAEKPTTAGGHLFLQHCQRVVAEAEAAEAAVMEIQKTPRGLVRISCPITRAEAVLGRLLPQYLIDNPQVRVEVTSTSRSLRRLRSLPSRWLTCTLLIPNEQRRCGSGSRGTWLRLGESPSPEYGGSLRA
jgi:hypothetical protein